jgi:ElaB/YqjD/DUF883 family membrane-anchored ribosome-binding protein
MRQNILERTEEFIGESADRASRAAGAVAGTMEDGVGFAKRAAREGRDTAGDLLDGAARRIQRNPIKVALAACAVALGAGVVIGTLLKRR